jgi:hypothetical protein
MRAPLRRREAEEELRLVGNQLRARDPGGERHLLGESSADEALAHAGHLEEVVQLSEDRLRSRGHVTEGVAAEEHGQVVFLEHERLVVACEPRRLTQDRRTPERDPGGLLVCGQVIRVREATCQTRQEDLEVGLTPGNGHAEALRGLRIGTVELPERCFKPLPGLQERGRRRREAELGGDELVVPRRDEHFHAVAKRHLDPAEQVLLTRSRALERGECRSRRRGGEGVGERVQPRGGQRGALDELTPVQLHPV